MNKEEIKKLQNFIKENNLQNDELLEKIMSIDVDKSDRQKSYWQSINGKFFKKKLNTQVELVHVSSVEILFDNTIRVTVNRYTFNTGYQNISLYSEENHYIYNLYENRYNSYVEITREEYDEILHKLKDLVKKSKTLFSQI